MFQSISSSRRETVGFEEGMITAMKYVQNTQIHNKWIFQAIQEHFTLFSAFKRGYTSYLIQIFNRIDI